MNRYFSVIGILFCCIAVSTLEGCSDYTEYIPIVLTIDKGDHILQEAPQLLTPEHVEAMKVILDSNGLSYKVVDGKLYIKESLQKDHDLLQNYTLKAEAFRIGGKIPGQAVPVK